MDESHWILSIIISIFLVNPLVAAVTLPGSENERVLHVCKNDMGGLFCDAGSVIWIKFIESGHSANYANDSKGGITCPRDESTDCNKSIEPANLIVKIGFQRGYEITVPDESVTCNGETVPVNYVHFTYCCIELVQLNPLDLCTSSTKVTSKGFIANDGFPLTFRGTHDCSCVLLPQIPTTGRVPITVSVMYARLPEPQEGAEELRIEDQYGREIQLHRYSATSSRLRSPSTNWDLSNTITSERLTLRFVKTQDEYSGSRKLRILLGYQANVPMRVTCGPTASINISEEIEPYTAEQAGNAIALETTEVDLGGHEDPSSSTHTQYGMGMQDILTVVQVAASIAVIIAFVIVTVIWTRKMRKYPPMSRNEEGEEYDDTVSPRYTTTPGACLALTPTDSTSAQGQTPLLPVPTACKGDIDNECMYEELTGC